MHNGRDCYFKLIQNSRDEWVKKISLYSGLAVVQSKSQSRVLSIKEIERIILKKDPDVLMIDDTHVEENAAVNPSSKNRSFE